MQRTRKFLSIILSVMMVLSVFPITASALTSGDWTYEIISEANQTAQITGYTGTETELKIPSTINGYKITTIANNAFRDNTTITSAIIPEGITTLGRYMFYGCKALEHVVIPEGVKTISYAAFMMSALTSISIPVSVTKIDDYAFEYCSKLDVIFYAGTKEQWNSITVVGDFSQRYNYLKAADVFYDSTNNQFVSGTCGENALWALNTVTGVLTISGTGPMATYNLIAQIPWASYRTLIKQVVINNGITSICMYAFYECENLESVSIPASLTQIGLDACK